MKTVLSCVLIACLVALSLAAPGSFFSKDDANVLKTLINGELKAGEFGGIYNNLAAVDALALLNAPLKDTSAICNSAAKALEGDLSSIVVGLKTRAALKCPNAGQVPEGALNKIDEALGKTENALDQLTALSAVAIFNAKGIEKSKVDEAVKDLMDHLSNDGFKLHDDMENGSGYYTGLFLDALASLKGVLSKETKESVVSSGVDAVKGYLGSSSVHDDFSLSYPHLDSSVTEYTSTAILLDGLIKFNKAYSTKLGFNDDKVNKIANLFLSRTHVKTIEGAHSVLLGLHSLNAGTWRKPLIVTASQTTLKASAKGDDALVRFQVTDIFGAPASKLPKLFLVSLTTSDSTAPLINNQELTYSAESSSFDFNLLATKPAPGNFKLVLSVTPNKAESGPQPYAAIKTTTRYVKVISSIELSDLSVSIRKSKDSEGSSSSSATRDLTFSYGKKSSTSEIEVTDTDVLDFSFSIKSKITHKPVTVQQAFVLITQGENEVYFVAKYDNVKKVYAVQAPLARHISKLGGAGKFTLKLLIGDSYIDNSINWDVTSLKITLSESMSEKLSSRQKSEKDAASKLPKDFASVSSYKPEIHHKFRPADKRADVFISRAFTFIVLAPLGLFVLGLLFVGLNFGNCPSGLGIIFALIFHGCIVAIAYILYLFFQKNNLFQTLQLLCYALPPTIFFGHRALRAIAIKRAQNLAEDAAKDNPPPK